MIMAKMKARIKLKIGPAATTEILAQTEALLKDPWLSSSSSSPTIIQEPPMGNSFKEYRVSPMTLERSLGPIPRENSVTAMPFLFAKRKCPSSWKIMITENTKIAIIMLNLPPAFDPSVNILFDLQDFFYSRIWDHLMSFHSFFNNPVNIQERDLPVQKQSNSFFIGRIKYRRHRSPCSGSLHSQRQSFKGFCIRRFEGNRA